MKRINKYGDWEIILQPEALKHGTLLNFRSTGMEEKENGFHLMPTGLFRMIILKFSAPRYGSPDEDVQVENGRF